VRAWHAAAALGAVALVAAAVPLAAPEESARKPVRSASIVSIARPIEPYRAGEPKLGWIELRAADPDGGPGHAMLFHRDSRRSRGRTVRRNCAEYGIETALRRYPVRDGGSCVAQDPRQPDAPLLPALGTGSGQPISLHGQVSSEVARLVVAGPGGTHDVPRSRHGMFLVLYGAETDGTVTLTAHLRDGSTRFESFALPPDTAPRGSAEAVDPGGLPDWTAAADLRAWGARKGQTCAQFVQRIDAQAPPGRAGGEAGPPLCGDLRKDPLVADATAYGPRPGHHPFGPGPDSPERLIVWGAAGPAVRAIRVTGPGGTRELPLSEIGRAFITVYPGSVTPAEVAVEATLDDGRVLRHPAPVRLNAAPPRR
jgi:hypothetical protein